MSKIIIYILYIILCSTTRKELAALFIVTFSRFEVFHKGPPKGKESNCCCIFNLRQLQAKSVTAMLFFYFINYYVLYGIYISFFLYWYNLLLLK